MSPLNFFKGVSIDFGWVWVGGSTQLTWVAFFEKMDGFEHLKQYPPQMNEAVDGCLGNPSPIIADHELVVDPPPGETATRQISEYER